MKKNKRFLFSIFSFIVSSVLFLPIMISCSQQISNEIINPDKENTDSPPNNSKPPIETNPPSNPTPPPSNENFFKPYPGEIVDLDSQKRTINKTFLVSLIKTNDFGFNPSSYQKQLEFWYLKKDKTFLDNVFEQKNVSNWSSLKDFKIKSNDKLGVIDLSFTYGINEYDLTLNRNDGLMSDGDFNKKIDDISFNLNFSSSSIVSNRGKFPILSDWDNKPIYQDPKNDYNKVANFENNGLKLGNNIDDYVINQSIGGTGWLVDYLPSQSNTTNGRKFHDFIVATNMHVSNLSPFFVVDNNIGNKKGKWGVVLDPLFIKAQWFRNKGNIDYDNPNKFQSNYIAEKNLGNIISNLTFNNSYWNNGIVRNNFFQKVIRNKSRLNQEDSQTFSTWDHPLGSAIKEKETLMQDINLYKAIYKSRFEYNDIVDPFWISQLDQNKTVDYYNIASDLNFTKVRFYEDDLKINWPSLYNAIITNSLSQFLMPINVKPVDISKTVNYYSGGYPYYGDADDVFQKNNGYKHAYEKGPYFRNYKLKPNLEYLPFEQWPNNIEFGFENSTNAVKAKLSWKPGPKPDGEDMFRPFYSMDTVDHWNNWNEQVLNDTYKKNIYFNTNSSIINNWNINDVENATNPYQYKASASNRGMIQNYYNQAKKHMWSSSEYILGGASGSIVINPKLEVVGLISSYEYNLAFFKGVRNAIFEDFVNTSNSIIEGDKIILHGLLKQIKQLKLEPYIYKNITSKIN